MDQIEIRMQVTAVVDAMDLVSNASVSVLSRLVRDVHEVLKEQCPESAFEYLDRVYEWSSRAYRGCDGDKE